MDFGKTVLGIEFGSTRIKAVLIDERHLPIASGSYEWENRLKNGIWTYSMTDIHNGLQTCYADLKRDIREKFDTVPETFAAMGVSGMMHGYLPFDSQWRQLTEVRILRMKGIDTDGIVGITVLPRLGIDGIVDGTKEPVPTYVLNVVGAPENGGEVKKYPSSEVYEEGTEVTLTATEFSI